MPCNCDYLDPTHSELEAAKILIFNRELDGETFDDVEHEIHAMACRYPALTDGLVADFCARMTALGDVSGYSLELQIWWRDHQRADRERLADEQCEAKQKALKASALKKLTPEERRALDV